MVWDKWLVEQKSALDVAYKEGMEPTSTTTGTGTTSGETTSTQ